MNCLCTIAYILAQHEEDLHKINVDAVLIELKDQGILRDNEHAEVEGKDMKEKVLFLRRILPVRGDNAFRAFTQVLRQKNYDGLANMLDEGEMPRTQ